MRYVKCFRPLVRLFEVNARLTSALEAQLRDLRRRSYAARTLAMYLRARSFVLCQKARGVVDQIRRQHSFFS